jgi:thiol peroxidase
MAKVKLKGQEFGISGNLPAVGERAPSFKLTKSDLTDVSLEDFKGDKLVLNIFPSIDTDVCAASVRRFNELATKIPGVKVLAISKDLPFAHKRFCEANSIENVVTLSEMRNSDFSEKYGVKIVEGPLEGLNARSLVIIDGDGKVSYTQLVPEITQEPDYEAVLKAL